MLINNSNTTKTYKTHNKRVSPTLHKTNKSLSNNTSKTQNQNNPTINTLNP